MKDLTTAMNVSSSLRQHHAISVAVFALPSVIFELL